MLDHLLNAAYSRQQRDDAQEKLASELTKLPNQVLYALAMGQEKLAYSLGCDVPWLDRFKGTPLFQRAFEIEQQALQLEIQEQEARAQEQQYRDTEWGARSTLRDTLGVQRKMLDLELAALEEGLAFEGEGEPPAELPQEQPPEEEAKEESAPPTERRVPPPRQEEAKAKEAMRASFAFSKAAAALSASAAPTSPAAARHLPEKGALDKFAFGGALLKGLAGGMKAGLPGVGQSLAQAGGRTAQAFQRGGVQAGLRTAGRSALTLAAKHPAATAGAAGLGAGLLLGKASG